MEAHAQAHPIGIPFSSPDEEDPNQYFTKAKQLVSDYIMKQHISPVPPKIYVVWFAKTLQNWKALVSTNLPDGRYYELTYNGDKLETYVDVYTKQANEVVADRPIRNNVTNIRGDH